MAKFSTKQFSYHKDTNTFVVESSELRVDHKQQPVQFNPGANFRMVSHKTGKTMIAQILETKKDRENEIQSWEYELTDDEGFTGIKVTIFND